MNTDRDLSCQEALNDRLYALMEAAAEAGWSENEVALSVRELARAWRLWRYERRATDAQIAATRALRS